MRCPIVPLLAWFILACLPAEGLCGGLHFYMSNLPPLTYVDESGRYTGLAVELDRAILAMAGMPLGQDDIHNITWVRAYHTALTKPGSALFCLMRTPEREDLFKWVGPLLASNVGLIAKKSSKIRVDETTNLSKYSICVVRGSAQEGLLNSLRARRGGMPARVSSTLSQVRMLKEGRVDMIVGDDVAISQVMRRLGCNPNLFEMVSVLAGKEYYMALHRSVDNAVAGRLQACLEAMQCKGADGKSPYDKIVDKYFVRGTFRGSE